MRPVAFVVVVPVLLLAVACGSLDANDARASTTQPAKDSTTTAPVTATSFAVDISTTSTTAAGATTTAAPKRTGGPTGKILMIKLFVGDDLAAAEKFYGAAFGAKKVGSVGDGVDIVTFPDGGPGLLLIKSKADDEKYGAMIVQVPDLDVAKRAALANGAKEQGTFGGSPGGMAAKSVDVLDPWGNQIEILQLG